MYFLLAGAEHAELLVGLVDLDPRHRRRTDDKARADGGEIAVQAAKQAIVPEPACNSACKRVSQGPSSAT